MNTTPTPSPPLSEAIGSKVCLANEFSRLLTKLVGPWKMRMIRSRNRVEPNSTVCHSHDFCDANMVMDAAFQHFGIDPCATGIPDTDFPLMSEEVMDWWNDAWTLAKAAGFRPLPEQVNQPRKIAQNT